MGQSEGGFEVFKKAAEELPSAAREFANEVWENPKEAINHAAEVVLVSGAFGAALGYVLPARGPAAWVIGAGLTVPVAINGIKRLASAYDESLQPWADQDAIAHKLAKDSVGGAVDFGLSFGGGYLGAELGFAASQSRGLLGNISQGSQRAIIGAENRALAMLRTNHSGEIIVNAPKMPSGSITTFKGPTESGQPISLSLDGVKRASTTGLIRGFKPDGAVNRRLGQFLGENEDLTLYFGSLHGHSRYSDGMGLPKDLYNKAIEQGQHVTTITDHNHLAARGGVKPNDPRAGDQAGTPTVAENPIEYAQTFADAAATTIPGKHVSLVGTELGTIGKVGGHAHQDFAATEATATGTQGLAQLEIKPPTKVAELNPGTPAESPLPGPPNSPGAPPESPIPGPVEANTLKTGSTTGANDGTPGTLDMLKELKNPKPTKQPDGGETTGTGETTKPGGETTKPSGETTKPGDTTGKTGDQTTGGDHNHTGPEIHVETPAEALSADHLGGVNHINLLEVETFFEAIREPRHPVSNFFRRLVNMDTGPVVKPPDVVKYNDGDYKALVNHLDKLKDSTGGTPVIQLNHPRYLADHNPNLPAGARDRDYGQKSFKNRKEWLERFADPYVRQIELIKGEALNPNPVDVVKAGDMDPKSFAGYIDMKVHASPTFGRDFHFGEPVNNPGATGILSKNLDKHSIMEALRQRRTIATTSRDNLYGVLSANDKHVMGSILDQAAVNDLTLTMQIGGNLHAEAQYSVKVWGDGRLGDGKLARILQEQEMTGAELLAQGSKVTFDPIAHKLGNSSAYYVEVARKDALTGNLDRMWTAPIWVEPLSGSKHSIFARLMAGDQSQQILSK